MYRNLSDRFSLLAWRTTPPEISWLMAQAIETPGLISLAAGFVDQESLPNEFAAKYMREMFERNRSGQSALQYGTTQGDLVLRQHLIERLAGEGVFHPAAEIDESHVLIGSGSQQILYLAAEAFLDENDIVLLEAPTYFVVLGVFKTRGARTIGIDTDAYGIVPKKVEEVLLQLKAQAKLGRVKMLYVMSYATNPMGITLAFERRRQLLEILQRFRDDGYPILLLEDAAYRRLCFEQPVMPPIKSFEADNDLVLYTESLSKSLSPGIRLGFGVGPKPIIDKMTDIKGNHDFGSANLSQQFLKRMLISREFDAHTEQLRQIYAQKRDAVLQILRETFPAEVEWLNPAGGFYCWITLPSSFDTGPHGAIFQQALKEKVLYVPGCLCYSADRPESRHSSSMRLAYGMIEVEQLQEGCKRLARALERSLSLTT
jgi:2-aminoadipate transaminase